jgi:hypothetical protein
LGSRRGWQRVSELSRAMDSLSESQKYEVVMQSYGASILESSVRNTTALQSMLALYREMVEGNQVPSQRSTRTLLNAAATFCSCDTLGDAFKLFISGGAVRVFGVGVGRLSAPVVREESGSFLEAVPNDEREKEVLLASVVGALILSWGGLEVASLFNHDADTASFWLVMTSALAVGLDVYFRAGKELRMAAAGLDRLTLRDSEREQHCESAALVAGYTLGLPCFCFRPDTLEALRMFRDSPRALDAYKQPRARYAKSAAVSTLSSTGSMLESAMRSFKSQTGGSSKQPSLATLIIPPIISTVDPETDVFALGRVLVWLMAPVAAEKLKYGSSVLSDPRRSRRFLTSLDALRQEARRKLDNKGIAMNEVDRKFTVQLSELPLPETAADQDCLLRWAYFEAASLVRQYADLLEELSDYLESGSSSAGECALLIEERLT